MQELEKILEELKRIKDGNRREKLYAKYPPNSKDQEVLNAYSQGYEDGTDNFYNAAAEIIRKHMKTNETFEFDFSGVESFDCQCGRHYINTAINDGWISVDERLPEDGTYLCTLAGELCGIEEPFTGMCGIENGIWDEPDCVIAWRPLPEPYHAERSRE